jgi:hypothetical protein
MASTRRALQPLSASRSNSRPKEHTVAQAKHKLGLGPGATQLASRSGHSQSQEAGPVPQPAPVAQTANRRENLSRLLAAIGKLVHEGPISLVFPEDAVGSKTSLPVLPRTASKVVSCYCLLMPTCLLFLEKIAGASPPYRLRSSVDELELCWLDSWDAASALVSPPNVRSAAGQLTGGRVWRGRRAPVGMVTAPTHVPWSGRSPRCCSPAKTRPLRWNGSLTSPAALAKNAQRRSTPVLRGSSPSAPLRKARRRHRPNI